MTALLKDPRFPQAREKLDESLQTIHETASTMQSLLDDLLDVSLIKEGKLSINKRPAKLVDLIKHAIEFHQQEGAEKQVSIAEDSEEIPDFLFDSGRISQVIGKLLSNAIKSSPAESTVVVSTRIKGEEVKVAVTDRGPGLNMGDLDTLIDLKTVITKPTGNERSLALGLAIAKKIVNLHNGRLQAKSLPEGGTTFSFTLPLAP